MTNPSKRMKTAYELALERMEQRGIERPQAGALSEAEREQVADLRRKAEAKVAELEILHRDRLVKIDDPMKRKQEQEEFEIERQRVEKDRDRRIEKLRDAK